MLDFGIENVSELWYASNIKTNGGNSNEKECWIYVLENVAKFNENRFSLISFSEDWKLSYDLLEIILQTLPKCIGLESLKKTG